jgi:lipoprotein LprG
VRRPLISTPRRVGAVTLALAALGATACGGSSHHASSPTTQPGATSAGGLLAAAKTTLDAAPAVHFGLTSANVTGGGTQLKGGSGDVVRPDRMQGSFDVSISGFSATVKIAAVGNVFEAQPPFQSGYSKTDPATYGLGNPSTLLDPNIGLSALLTHAQGATSAGQTRLAGELLDQVRATVPGRAVPVLPDQNRSAPVALLADINPDSHQLRQVVLTGPFTSKTADSTYTVTLTNYGEPVTVTLPPT